MDLIDSLHCILARCIPLLEGRSMHGEKVHKIEEKGGEYGQENFK